MGTLRLDIHGVGVELCGPEGVLEELRRDFAYFQAREPASDPIRFELSASTPRALSSGSFALRWRDYSAFDEGPVRRVEYDDEARAVYDFERRSGTLECARPQRLRELAYLAVLSRAGDALDARGLHRVHALAFESGGEGGLVVLPCGGGKSSLALELLRRTSLGILAEDTALVESGLRSLAFPLRWGLRGRPSPAEVPVDWVRPFERRGRDVKWVVDLPFYRDRVRESAPLRWVFFGERSPGPALSLRIGTAEAAARLSAPLVLGVGIAQMTEYCIRWRPGALGSLAVTAARRARLAWRLAQRVEAFALRMGGGPADAADALLARVEPATRFSRPSAAWTS